MTVTSSVPVGSVRFWPHIADAGIASTRIRCLQVIDGLRFEGLDCALHDAAQPAPAVLVLAKRYDRDSLAQARALRDRAGTRLILDLCDNHFHHDPSATGWALRAASLREACGAVDAVVAASATLAQVIRDECPDAPLVHVVPDALDGQILAGADTRGWADRLHAGRWRAFQAIHPVPTGRRLLWFGNHGSRHAEGGMVDLNRVATALAAHQAQSPLSLTVLSNRWRSFRRLRVGWTWPSFYLPWSPANFALAAAQHDVVLIPAQRNPFTLCKTNNRLATAFTQGLAVAADGLPSYLEFQDLAVLDDWEDGLGRLMASADERRHRVALARQRLEERYSLPKISRRWIDVLQSTAGRAAA